MPSVLVQGAGRPDFTAKMHLVELPFYLLAFWWSLGAFSIEGAAIVWVVRATAETMMKGLLLSLALPLFGLATWFLIFSGGARCYRSASRYNGSLKWRR